MPPWTYACAQRRGPRTPWPGRRSRALHGGALRHPRGACGPHPVGPQRSRRPRHALGHVRRARTPDRTAEPRRGVPGRKERCGEGGHPHRLVPLDGAVDAHAPPRVSDDRSAHRALGGRALGRTGAHSAEHRIRSRRCARVGTRRELGASARLEERDPRAARAHVPGGRTPDSRHRPDPGGATRLGRRADRDASRGRQGPASARGARRCRRAACRPQRTEHPGWDLGALPRPARTQHPAPRLDRASPSRARSSRLLPSHRRRPLSPLGRSESRRGRRGGGRGGVRSRDHPARQRGPRARRSALDPNSGTGRSSASRAARTASWVRTRPTPCGIRTTGSSAGASAGDRELTHLDDVRGLEQHTLEDPAFLRLAFPRRAPP